jgi:hypothetical protein
MRYQQIQTKISIMIKYFMTVVMCAIVPVVMAADYQGDYMMGIIPPGWEERSCEKVNHVEISKRGSIMWISFQSATYRHYGIGIWAKRGWDAVTAIDPVEGNGLFQNKGWENIRPDAPEPYSSFQYAHLNNKPINNSNMIKPGMWCRVSKMDRYDEPSWAQQSEQTRWAAGALKSMDCVDTRFYCAPGMIRPWYGRK